MRDRTPSSVLSLAAAGEPFRLLFPLGTALGVVGVLLWPAFAAGMLDVYPAPAHARIMTQGFLGSFVIGFLGTALPRLLEVPKVGLRESSVLGAGLALVVVIHTLGGTTLGDALFLVLLTAFVWMLWARARQRQDTPPPGFLLVGMGLACAWLGTALFVLDGLPAAQIRAELYALARLFAWQGFVLLPVMGIGAFLLPRFFGLPNKHAFPELLVPSQEWKRRAAYAGACGGLVLLGFVLEAFGWPRTGVGLRALAVLAYLLREVPIHRAREKGGLAFGLRLALVSIPLGYVLIAVFPGWQLALVHVVFITGFSLITFTVASRVLLGHSGQSARFRERHDSIRWLAALFVLALLLRVWADFDAEHRFVFYGAAGLIWAIGALVWSCAFLPAVRYPDDE